MAHSPLVAESARLVQALQQDLAEAGITLVGKQLSDARWTEVTQDPAATRAGEWDLCLGRWLSDWGGDAAASFFVSLVGGRAAFPPNGPNTGLYEDAQTQALIESALDAPTRAEAAERWHAADLQLMSQAAVYPITNPRFPTYHASHVHNAVFLQDFLQLDPTNVWLSPGKQGG
jgi:peptide/nickel transport system substrate-binding protein